MSRRERERSYTETSPFPHRRTPSFSSSLLDAIYRSFDDSNSADHQDFGFIKEKNSSAKRRSNAGLVNCRREMVVDKWLEKQSVHGFASTHLNSASSSSDSSSSGIFSSSGGESSYRDKSTRSSFPVHSLKQGRPQRRDLCFPFEPKDSDNNDRQKSRKDSGLNFTKTKLKALKIYGELKKVKQPISPGGRISTFLNSIFNGNAKKVKICSIGATEDVSFERKSKSACSSATSFSRSCLSKTPPSRGSSNNNTTNKKRSVRFYPVSVIVDEDCRPCGHKSIYGDDPSLMPTPTATVEKSVTKGRSPFTENDVTRIYQTKMERELSLRAFINGDDDAEEEDDGNDDEDEVLSCSSSDLFELDHLIGIGRYREELPVYETTSLETNQAIAKGLIL